MNSRNALLCAAAALCVLAPLWAKFRPWSAWANAPSPGDVRWTFSAASVLLCLGFAALYALCWATLLQSLDGARVRRVAAVRLFLLTWPGRYLPASLGHYGGRFVAGPALGARRSALAASFVYENLLTIAAAGAVSVVLLLAQSRSLFGGGAWAAVAIGAAMIALAALHPVVSRAGIRIMARRVRRLAPLERSVLPVSVLVRLFAGYALGAALVGLAFSVMLRGLGADVSPLTAVAVYNLAGIAGMLAIAVPGGVGVREGVVVALLSGVVSPPVALAAALLTRLAGVVADLMPFAFILAIDAVRRVARARKPLPLEPAPVLREAA
jgi:glycosyltransferase 2 family protein